MHWKILGSQYVLNHPWMKVRKDVCKLPDGTIINDYYWIESLDNTLVVPITSQGDVVVVKQYKHGAKEVLIEFPGGVMDSGEEALAGAQRELLEETGYGDGIWTFLDAVYTGPTKSPARTHIFLAEGVISKQRQALDPAERIEVLTMDWKKLSAIGIKTCNSSLAMRLAAEKIDL
jgi:8-oxo-dGTP pyrophosphatase MutT (NUDIX family)